MGCDSIVGVGKAWLVECIVRCMTTQLEAGTFASEWIAAWNSHDLDAIMCHYGADVVLISPVAAKILDDPSGTVKGEAALRNYFRRGLEAYPNLHFELLDVMYGLSSVVLCYTNQKGTKTAEFMEFDDNGRVVRVVANYGG
jgi:ketosteroid isomerase-like protein